MTQTTIQFDERRMAREHDPLTSKVAARNSVVRAGSQRDVILNLVKTHPGLTSAELSELSPWPVDSRRFVAARRLPELRGDGWLENGRVRECRVTGEMAMTWYAFGVLRRDNL